MSTYNVNNQNHIFKVKNFNIPFIDQRTVSKYIQELKSSHVVGPDVVPCILKHHSAGPDVVPLKHHSQLYYSTNHLNCPIFPPFGNNNL